MRCPDCGFVVIENEAFCSQCGRRWGDRTSTDAAPASRFVKRYRDAYRTASFLVTLGNVIKVGGVVVGVLVILMMASAGKNLGAGLGLGVGGVFFGALLAGVFFIVGVVVSAEGQKLLAHLDVAVAESPFMTDDERLQAMGLEGAYAAQRR